MTVALATDGQSADTETMWRLLLSAGAFFLSVPYFLCTSLVRANNIKQTGEIRDKYNQSIIAAVAAQAPVLLRLYLALPREDAVGETPGYS